VVIILISEVKEYLRIKKGVAAMELDKPRSTS
jgi:hypothetical protein